MMTRQAELEDLRDQAVRHALIAERMGFVATAEALWALARDAEQEGGGMFGMPWQGRAARDPAPWRSEVRPLLAAEG